MRQKKTFERSRDDVLRRDSSSPSTVVDVGVVIGVVVV
jgi:hypothetical protein